jgi:hypothetical protein
VVDSQALKLGVVASVVDLPGEARQNPTRRLQERRHQGAVGALTVLQEKGVRTKVGKLAGHLASPEIQVRLLDQEGVEAVEKEGQQAKRPLHQCQATWPAQVLHRNQK